MDSSKENYMANDILMTEETKSHQSNLTPWMMAGFMAFTLVGPEQTFASDVVPSKPATEVVSYGTSDNVGRSQKKNRRRHSKEGYMTEQQWKDYFDARDNGEPTPSDNLILGTEDDFKQIHSGRIIKDV